MMMLGREVTLPVDLTMEHPPNSNEEVQTDYAGQLIKEPDPEGMSLRWQKKNYDRRAAVSGIRGTSLYGCLTPQDRRGEGFAINCD